MKDQPKILSCGGRGRRLCAALARPTPGSGDWPMWGGTPDRNMVSAMNGARHVSWDIQTKKNVKWMARARARRAYGNPVVAGGMVFVGTNNEAVRDPKEPGDRGVLMAFRESDGEFLWQHTNEKLAAGRVNDWPFQGVCSLAAGGRRPALLRHQPLPRWSALGHPRGTTDNRPRSSGRST